MIQDIAPHCYDNHYEEYEAGCEDYCVCVREGKALMKRGRDGWGFPDFAGMEARLHREVKKAATYLFSIDGRHYFLYQILTEHESGLPEDESNIAAGPADGLQAAGDTDYCWKNRRDMREVAPREAAFAGITALQLDGWYRSNRYCGHCGKPLEKDHKERMLRCRECGNLVYPRINPAVIIGITRGNKLLMTKYAGRTYTRYALVAGFAEIGETLEQTVARETMEETGLRVKNIRYYKSQPWSFSDTLLTGFFCEADGDDAIRLDKRELSEGCWIAREDIDKAQESYDDLSLTNEMIRYFRDNETLFTGQ